MFALQTTIVDAVENIALADPISTVLFLLGGLITGAAVLILGGLALGATVDLFTPT
jgi:hypothetical protein